MEHNDQKARQNTPYRKIMFKKTIAIALTTIIFLAIGYVLIRAYPNFVKTDASISENKASAKVTIEFWGLWDNSDTWEEIINQFEKKDYEFNGQKMNIEINYTKKDFSSYQKELSEAKQKNMEPNAFVINNNWLGKYAGWLYPIDKDDAYVEEYKLVKYDELLNLFPAEAIRSLIYNDNLYGLPTYSDSLALYYNKDLFKEAGIENPPKTWKEFKDDVKRLTKIDNENNIIQSGTAFGSGKNVNRSSDILSILVMQGGAQVIDNGGNININREVEINTKGGIEKRNPGKTAIVFYTEFSDPQKEIYTWNAEQGNSIEAFASGKAAMIFGYSYQIKNLLAKNPDLNYDVSPMPQLEDSTIVNFSNVWTPVVSKNSNCLVGPRELADKIDCPKIVWSFLSFAIQKENSKLYLNSMGKPAVRKDLIAEQIGANDKMGVFASQAESAITYNKFDDKIDDILVEMIDEINSNRENLEEKINAAVGKIEGLKNQNEYRYRHHIPK